MKNKKGISLITLVITIIIIIILAGTEIECTNYTYCKGTVSRVTLSGLTAYPESQCSVAVYGAQCSECHKVYGTNSYVLSASGSYWTGNADGSIDAPSVCTEKKCYTHNATSTHYVIINGCTHSKTEEHYYN